MQTYIVQTVFTKHSEYIFQCVVLYIFQDSIRTKDVNIAVESYKRELKEKDRKLFSYAEEVVCQYDMSDTELFISFQDREGVCIKSNNNPKNRMVVKYRDDGVLDYFWENTSIYRKATSLIVTCLSAIWRAIWRLFSQPFPVVIDTLKAL